MELEAIGGTKPEKYNAKDSLIWACSKIEKYNAKDGYRVLANFGNQEEQHIPLKLFWSSKIIPKAGIFAWPFPENGKVIAVDSILPVAAETSSYAGQTSHVDLRMLVFNPVGKERTEEEFKDLAKAIGFVGGVKPICCVNGV
ncbi:hypothetical protein SUGI_1180060 [Cryptomeria japonica]|nr:hypothetical protein SUGI_1180060 [Cryptomeria japonica]